MTTYNYVDTTDNQFGGSEPNAYAGSSKVWVAQRTMNFATMCTDLGVSSLVQNSIVQFMTIPADTYILGISVKVSTASDTADDIDFGAGTVDGFLDALNMTSTGHTFSLATENESVAVGGGAFFSSADTLDLKVITASAVDDGIFTVTIIGVDCS